MSVDLYPAYSVGKEIFHADNWDPQSTLNLANGNFYPLMDYLGFPRSMIEIPGHMATKSLAMAIKTKRHPAYHDKLVKLVAQAEVLRAPLIAFS